VENVSKEKERKFLYWEKRRYPVSMYGRMTCSIYWVAVYSDGTKREQDVRPNTEGRHIKDYSR